jgi:hypothetical protein
MLGLILVNVSKGSPSFASTIGLCIVSFIGVIIREIIILVPISLLFAKNPIKKPLSVSSLKYNLSWHYIAPLGCAIVGALVTHIFAVQTNNYSFLLRAIWFLYKKPALTYIYAWFIAYGPIIVILVYKWEMVIDFLKSHQFHGIYLITISVLGWIGGTDTERILYWSMPIVYLLFAIILQNGNILALLTKHYIFTAFLIISQSISQRLFWIIPDPNLSTPSSIPIISSLGNHGMYQDLWSSGAKLKISFIFTCQYLILSVVMVLWLKYMTRVNMVRQ